MAKSKTIMAVLCVMLAGVMLGAGPAFAQTGNTAAKISLNKATAAQLSKLPGITAGLAKAIVDYRQKNGPFKKMDELARVPGMTKEIMKKAGVQENGKGDLIAPTPGSGDEDEEPTLKPSKC